MTKEEKLVNALLDAQNKKWDGWTWKEYQKAIVRQNYKIDELLNQINCQR